MVVCFEDGDESGRLLRGHGSVSTSAVGTTEPLGGSRGGLLIVGVGVKIVVEDL